MTGYCSYDLTFQRGVEASGLRSTASAAVLNGALEGRAFSAKSEINARAGGKPVAFYSDRHSIFRVNAKDAVGGRRRNTVRPRTEGT